jgi:restriction system protein
MTNYYRVMLGRKSAHAAECFAGGFIGTDFDIREDLSRKLPDEWREFNKQFIPVLLAKQPDMTKIGAGLRCGALWTVSKGIKKADLVLCPDGAGSYHVGEVLGDYYHAGGQILPHHRKVRWLDTTIARSAMSKALQNSTGSIGTVSNITDCHDEIERLLGAACCRSELLSSRAIRTSKTPLPSPWKSIWRTSSSPTGINQC